MTITNQNQVLKPPKSVGNGLVRIQQVFAPDGVQGQQKAEDEENREVKATVPDHEEDKSEGHVKTPADNPPTGKTEERLLQVAGLQKRRPTHRKKEGVAESAGIGHQRGKDDHHPCGGPANDFGSNRDGFAGWLMVVFV